MYLNIKECVNIIRRNTHVSTRLYVPCLGYCVFQEKFALNAGITLAYLGLLERGKRNAIEKLCDALRVSLADFFSIADKCTPIQNNVGIQIPCKCGCESEIYSF